MAADKDGNVGYWHARKVFMQGCDTTAAPLGLNGAIRVSGPGDLPKDVIPFKYMPHVINPTNRMAASDPDDHPLRRIILSGNNAPVGKWYPLPIYANVWGDTTRSYRLRELLSDRGASGTFTPEDLLVFTYDDVSVLARMHLDVAFRQLAQYPANYGGFILTHYINGYANGSYQMEPLPVAHEAAAYTMLATIADSNFGPHWLSAGASFHSEHPLAGGIDNLVARPLRPFPYRVLSREFGQGESGMLMLARAMKEIVTASANNDLFDGSAWSNYFSDPDDRTAAALEARDYLNHYLGNGWTRSVYGQAYHNKAPNQRIQMLATNPEDWKAVYLSRYFNVDDSPGARFRIQFLNDSTYGGLGSLNPDQDHPRTGSLDAVLHNPTTGIGAQAWRCYVQWVHFRWHELELPPGQNPHAYAVASLGNSNHPGSPFFHAEDPPERGFKLWVEDGLDFDQLQVAQDPTRYLREAPLQ